MKPSTICILVALALIAGLVTANNTGGLRKFTDWYFANE
jgi:hypothetical protein